MEEVVIETSPERERGERETVSRKGKSGRERFFVINAINDIQSSNPRRSCADRCGKAGKLDQY